MISIVFFVNAIISIFAVSLANNFLKKRDEEKLIREIYKNPMSYIHHYQSLNEKEKYLIYEFCFNHLSQQSIEDCHCLLRDWLDSDYIVLKTAAQKYWDQCEEYERTRINAYALEGYERYQMLLIAENQEANQFLKFQLKTQEKQLNSLKQIGNIVGSMFLLQIMDRSKRKH